jgi:hypothetical protein
LVIVVLGAAISIGYYFLTKDKVKEDDNPGVAVRVEILNGCGVSGIARRAMVYLRERGYDVLSVGDSKEKFARTIVIERRSRDNVNAKALARTLGLDRSSVTQSLDSLSPVYVTLIVGSDYPRYLPDTVEKIQ